jgi:hypothetical protein
MGLFSRRKKQDIQIEPPANSRVEVELHKGASVEAADKAIQANRHLNDLLIENGFTLKIYLAAGGQLSQKKQGGKV